MSDYYDGIQKAAQARLAEAQAELAKEQTRQLRLSQSSENAQYLMLETTTAPLEEKMKEINEAFQQFEARLEAVEKRLNALKETEGKD